jgi:hypothetical protein
MTPVRRVAALALVAGVALGCSATSSPPSPRSSAPPTSPRAVALLPHQVVAGTNVAGAFDLATDGTVIAWSDGTVDVDAPALWRFDPATGDMTVVYRSATPGAILSNLAVRHGTYAFGEVTPRADGSRTWRLVVLDPTGRTQILDANDVPSDQVGVLPMAAISDRGVLWATNHAGGSRSLRCELRYSLLSDLRPRVLASEPCSRTEFWYPRSDGRRLVYGTVEYSGNGGADARHVYLVDDTDLEQPRRLDADGQASLPAILDDTVVWKDAPLDLNMFSPAGLTALELTAGATAHDVPFPSVGPPQLTTPSIGPGFVVGDDVRGGSVVAWDRRREVAVDVDHLAGTDPGFLSGARLADSLLAWFYTSSAQGGGTREIRWLTLPSE